MTGPIDDPVKCIILTTNDPMTIKDKDFNIMFRKGKMDINIEMPRPDNNLIKQLIKRWFNRSVDESIQFPENQYTCGEIISMCIDLNDFDLVCEKLINQTIQPTN